MATYEDEASMSSPDPLNDSIPSSLARRVTRSQRSKNFMTLGGPSVSPRRQTFSLEVGDNRTPQRLFVTVESEQQQQQQQLEQAGAVRRRLFPSSSPSKTPRARITTTTVPLRDDDDDDDDLTAMTSATPKKRGRPRKYAPTPKPGAKKRAGTPARKGTPGRPRKNPVAEDEPGSEARTQPTPKASAKKRATATAGQEPASDVTQATPASQGKRGAKRKAADEVPSSAPATSAKKRGRPRKKPIVVEEVPEVPEEQDAIEPPAAAEVEDSPAPEPVGPADNGVPASDGDIWMDTLSNEATPRPSFMSRSLNRSTATANQPDQSPEPPNAPEADDHAPLADARDDTPERAEQPDSDLDEVLLVSRPTDTMSDAMSEASRPGFGRRLREDTIVQSEEFSMIFTESMRSLRASARGAPVTNASDEIGDNTNLFINKTLESIRNGMRSDAGSSEHGRDNGSTGHQGEQDREVEELPQEEPAQEQESFSLSLFARSQYEAEPEVQHTGEYEEQREEHPEEQQPFALEAPSEQHMEPAPRHVEEYQQDDRTSPVFRHSVQDMEHAAQHTDEPQEAEEQQEGHAEDHAEEQQRARHTSPLIALSEDDVDPEYQHAEEQEEKDHTSPLHRHSMRAMESQIHDTDEQQQEEQQSSPHERSMRDMEPDFQHDEYEDEDGDMAEEYQTQEPEWEADQHETLASQSRQAPAEPQSLSSPAVASPVGWWSESPRRNKTPSLGRQLLTFKAMQSQQSLAGESPSQRPFAPSRDSSRRNSANPPGEDSNLYEDSFSEIPDEVLEAATPRRPERTGVPAPDPAPPQQPDAQGKDAVSGVSVATDTIRSDASRMLTPDETPSPRRQDGAPEPKPVEAAPVETDLAPEPAREPSKSASPPAHAEQPNLLALRRSSQDKITPVGLASSPQLPGLPDVNAHRASPEQERRPTLSPIMRAGLALQSVTSDHSSPLGKGLGSPFKASANTTPRRGSLQGRETELPAGRAASHQPEVPSSDDPFGPSRVHNGQDSFMRALDESARYAPSQRSSAPPSVFNSTRATLEELEEMSWVAEDPTPAPIAYETVASRSSSMSGHFGSIVERQNAGVAGAGTGEAGNTAEAMDEGNGDDDDEDIWVTEAQRSTPKQPERRAFGAGAAQRGARRNLIPETWRRDARAAPSDETGGDRLNESQLEEYSLLSQKKNTSMRLPSSAAKPGLDLSKFFSSPTVLPNMPSANPTRRSVAPRAAPTPAQTLPSNSMFPAVPQKAFQPSPVRRNLFSSAASASVATSAAPQTSPAKSTGTSMAERQQPAPSTPERTNDHSIVEQKQNFTPRRGQSASLFAPSSARATVPTPPQMQLSRNDIERWQEETSRVLGESSPPEVQREPLPHRTMSPTKSCLRSPLKARTPGRVVEFAGEVTSPLQARGGSNARRLVAGVQLKPMEDVAEVQSRPREVSVASPVKSREAASAAQPKPRASVLELQPRPREAGAASPLKTRDAVPAAQLKPRDRAPTVQFKPDVPTVREEDKENSPTDALAAEAPPKPHQLPRLSRQIWSKNHWILLETLLQLRRKGPYPFDIQASGYARRSAGLLGRVASGDGKTMEIEAWHLDVVDAFRAEVGGWDEGVLAKRLFALVAGEGGKVRA